MLVQRARDIRLLDNADDILDGNDRDLAACEKRTDDGARGAIGGREIGRRALERLVGMDHARRVDRHAGRGVRAELAEVRAHEAGGVEAEVELSLVCAGGDQRIEVRDRGSGMSQTVLAQALLPFYSTKRSGTGLGLALAREIAEAHGGRIHLANREGGGLVVTLDLPWSSQAADATVTP